LIVPVANLAPTRTTCRHRGCHAGCDSACAKLYDFVVELRQVGRSGLETARPSRSIYQHLELSAVAVLLLVPPDGLHDFLHRDLALVPPDQSHPLPFQVLVYLEEVLDLLERVPGDVRDVEEFVLEGIVGGGQGRDERALSAPPLARRSCLRSSDCASKAARDVIG